MSKISLKKQVASLVLGLSVALFPTALPAQSAPAGTDAECSKEILLAFFPEVFVNETLTRFNVPKDKWDSIKQALAEKDKEVVKTVEAKAAQMNPNPLKDPQHRQEAVKLFRDTLLDVFSTVLKANGVSDDTQIKNMLDDIQQQKAKRFAMCLEKHKNDVKQGPSGDGEDSNDDEESDDDDDSDDDTEDQPGSSAKGTVPTPPKG